MNVCWGREDMRQKKGERKFDDLVFLELFLGSFIFSYKRFAWSAGYPHGKFKTLTLDKRKMLTFKERGFKKWYSSCLLKVILVCEGSNFIF